MPQARCLFSQKTDRGLDTFERPCLVAYITVKTQGGRLLLQLASPSLEKPLSEQKNARAGKMMRVSKDRGWKGEDENRRTNGKEGV